MKMQKYNQEEKTKGKAERCSKNKRLFPQLKKKFKCRKGKKKNQNKPNKEIVEKEDGKENMRQPK